MPNRPPRVCNRCRQTYTGTRCPCRPAWEGSSYGNSGTDRRQRNIRAQQLRDHPICQWPGCTRLAVTADHIRNLATGGSKYDPANYQSLCELNRPGSSGGLGYATSVSGVTRSR